MHGAVNTKVASGVVVLAWAVAATVVEALSPLPVSTILINAAGAVVFYLAATPIPIPEVPWKKTLVIFGLPILLAALAAAAAAFEHRVVSWAIVGSTLVTAGRVKDLIGDRRVYIGLFGPRS